MTGYPHRPTAEMNRLAAQVAVRRNAGLPYSLIQAQLGLAQSTCRDLYKRHTRRMERKRERMEATAPEPRPCPMPGYTGQWRGLMLRSTGRAWPRLRPVIVLPPAPRDLAAEQEGADRKALGEGGRCT